MGILQTLSLLALRPTVSGARDEPPGAKDADALTAVLTERFATVGPRLLRAFQTAGRRAWRTMEIALAGLPWWERSASSLNVPEDQPLRTVLQTFLRNAATADVLDGQRPFAQECGRELRMARRMGLLDDLLDLQSLPRLAVATWHAADQAGAAERRVVEQLAAALRTTGQPRLARLLELQAAAGTPLLVQAARAAFRHAVAKDDTLRQSLPWACAGPAAPAIGGLPELLDALDRHARRLGEVLDLRGTGLDSRGGALDLTVELPRLPPALQAIGHDALYLVGRYQVDHRELRPADFVAIGTDDERRAIQQLAARYRNTPEDQRRQAPALLNALGKLEALAGELETAQRAFLALGHLTPDPAAQAEVNANVYQVALERQHLSEALAALRRAAAREPDRFAPFPIASYEPEAILRSDAYGVWFLCRHRTDATLVEVQALTAEVLERSPADIFREAQLLAALEQPAILPQREGDFADPVQARPYLIAEHFDGLTLAEWVEQHGPVPPGELLPLGRAVAEALHAAHARGVLHRNLRPSNLLVNKDANGWQVKLINFGLTLKPSLLRAALVHPASRAPTRIGREAFRTLDYAAPEQLGRLPDVPAGPHTDAYSFGRTFYFALLRTPEPDDEEREGLPGGWRKLLGHCTSLTVARRHANFDPIVVRLTRPATHEAAPAKSDARLGPAPLPKSSQGTAPVPTGKSSPGLVPSPKSDPRLATAAGPPKGPGVATAPAVARTPVEALPPPRSEEEQAAACIQRGVALRTRGEFDKAIAEFNRAIQLDPQNPFAFEGRGNTFVNKGEFDRAIADYTQALRLDPNLALVHVNRGLAYVKKKDSEAAIADYTAAIQLDSKLALAYLNRGSAYARRGDYERAIGDYNTAIQLDGKLVLAYFNRGLARAKKGEHDLALADYDTVLKLDPGNSQALARKREAELQKRQGAAQGPPPIGQVRGKKKPPAATEPIQPRQVRLFEGHTDAIRAVAYAPDGRRILTAGEDKVLRLWDIKTAKTIVRYNGHTAGVTCVAVSPNGERVLSGGQDHTLRLWDLESGEERKRFGARGLFGGGQAHGEAVVSVAFSPDGLRAISASWDKTLRLWDVESAKEMKLYEGHQWLIHSVAFSPDGQHFLYGSEDQTARLYEVETGQEIRRFEGHSSWVLGVAFAADGRHVLTGSADGTARLWNVARGKEVRKFSGGMGLVQSVALSADGKLALTGEYSPASQETALFLWNAETGAQLARLIGHKQLIWSVQFSPDGKYAVSGSADMTARVWRLR